MWYKHPRKTGDLHVGKALSMEVYDSTYRYHSIGMAPGYTLGRVIRSLSFYSRVRFPQAW
jgi:hypothetical protein